MSRFKMQYKNYITLELFLNLHTYEIEKESEFDNLLIHIYSFTPNSYDKHFLWILFLSLSYISIVSLFFS